MKALLLVAIVASLAINAVLGYKVLFGLPATQTASSNRNAIVMQTPGGLLEVSKISAEERFDSTTNHTVLGVPVGRTVAQVRVPTVYRYHIPLAKDWNILLSGSNLLVVAPPVRPSLPVAIDTGKLESFSSGLWSPITGANAVNELQRTITDRLGEKAASQALVLLQRETARQTVGEFVHKWVVDQSRWKGLEPPTVFVFFADEPMGRKAAAQIAQAQ